MSFPSALKATQQTYHYLQLCQLQQHIETMPAIEHGSSSSSISSNSREQDTNWMQADTSTSCVQC